MQKRTFIVLLFYVAAFYDGILGLIFLFAGSNVFEMFQVTPPNHFGYIHFPALLLIIFSLMFLAIAGDPVKNRNLILYGILLKASYCGVVFFHWFTGGIPSIWKLFAFFDLAFMIIFIWIYVFPEYWEQTRN
jgi:hypothetical protein